jgi:biotin carboxylase
MPINDFGTRTAAFVSRKMGLIGISEKCSECANDKGLMREVWKKKKLIIPNFEVISNISQIEEFTLQYGFPVVLKPTDCGGSGRGISVISNKKEIKWAYQFAYPFVKNGRFIIEEFIDGVEMTVETISINEKVYILTTSDKIKANLKTRVATSLNFPSFFSYYYRNCYRNFSNKFIC